MYGSLRFAQLMAATVNNQERCVDLLLRWGVYVNEYDKGCLLLRLAAEKEYFFKQEPIRVLDCIAPRHEFNRMNSIKKGKKFQFLASFAGKMASDWLTGFAHAH